MKVIHMTGVHSFVIDGCLFYKDGSCKLMGLNERYRYMQSSKLDGTQIDSKKCQALSFCWVCPNPQGHADT